MMYQVHTYRPRPKTDDYIETTTRVEAGSAVDACRLIQPDFAAMGAKKGYMTTRRFLPDNVHFQANASGTKGVCAVALIPFIPAAN